MTYSCPRCQKLFMTEYERNEHQAKCGSGFVTYSCQICRQVFRSEFDRDRHEAQCRLSHRAKKCIHCGGTGYDVYRRKCIYCNGSGLVP